MTHGVALLEARNEVLRKIGRNVVNFQKMEAMLKFLNTQQAMSGSLSDISKLAARAKKVTSKQPMGRLADAFVRSVYSAKQGAVRQDDPTEVSFSFSVRIEADPALAAERKRALRSVVAERNKLIHKWAASFNPNSLETCEALAADLDKQNAKVLPEYETLKAIVLAVREYQRQAAQYLASNAFLADLKERITPPLNRDVSAHRKTT
jgi:hypothetical protein